MELVAQILGRTIKRLPFLSRLDPEFRVALFPLLKPLSFSAGELIFSKGQASRELLFVLDGEVIHSSAAI